MYFTSAMRLTITLYVLAAIITTGIVAYAAGASNERAVPLSERVLSECEIVEAGSDLGPILASVGYDLQVVGDGFLAHSPGCGIEAYEDGSAVKYDLDYNEVSTFPEDTFYWNCQTMGNKVCGK